MRIGAPRVKLQLFVTTVAFLAAASVAQAQATRTWVSGVGDDANPCSRTAPCKTFAGAISKTAAHGEINVLDPGGFGGLTITKSISVVNDGNIAGVLVTLGSSGMVVNAAATDVVVLKGLELEGVNSGGNAIRFLAGGSLHVQNCLIRNWAQRGIDFNPSGNSKLYVDDTIITDMGPTDATNGIGIHIRPGALGSAKAHIHNTRVQGNNRGIVVEARGNATITDSVVTGNAGNGLQALATSPNSAVIATDGVATTQNGANGIIADGTGAIVRIANMLIFGNTTGANNNGGSLVSWQNNRILGNTTQTSGTITPQNEL